MTRIETTKLLFLIQGVYPRFADGRDLEVMKQAWALVFARDDFAAVQKALLTYVATDVKGFPPMPGTLKSLMKPKVSEADAYLAWLEVRRALSNSLYGSREEFENLSPLCRRLVGSPAVLREWTMMDADRLDAAIGPGFQRSCRTAAQEETENSPSPCRCRTEEGLPNPAHASPREMCFTPFRFFVQTAWRTRGRGRRCRRSAGNRIGPTPPRRASTA